MSNEIGIEKTNTDECMDLIEKHVYSLANPLDSWLEEQLFLADKYLIRLKDEAIGYCAVIAETINFFFVQSEHFEYAPRALEQAVCELGVEKIFVMSQDSGLCALMIEWDYEMERSGCFFVDSGRSVIRTYKAQDAGFRKAVLEDCENIRQFAGDFFEDENSEYLSLEEKIENQTIFVLEENGELLGAGIVQRGRICRDYISIGMFTNKEHRKKGVAKTILLNLKDYVYSLGKKPAAGCWYYNTLSRKSLESAGMTASGLGFNAKLIKKDNPPKRTGNPPGELVE